jgi:hypothetical protein
MTLKLPRFHLDATVVSIFSKVARFAYRAIETVQYHKVYINMTVLPTFIDKAADGLINIVNYKGLAPECRRRFGPTWKDKLRCAVWHDICSAMYFATRVVDEYDVRDKFWDDSKYWFGPNFRLLEGSYNLLYMLSCTYIGKRMGNTGQHIEFHWKLVGVNEILKVAEAAYPKEFPEWKSSGFRDSSQVGVLVFLNTLLPGLSLKVPFFNTTSPQVCVGDLLTEPPTANDWIRGSESNDSKVLILNSDGVTDTSMALGLIYRFHYTQSTFTKGLDVKSAYIEWTGEADPQMRSRQIELWLGIEFLLPGEVPPAPGSGPSPEGGPTGPQSPSGGSGGSVRPSSSSVSNKPSSGSSPKSPSGGLGSGIKGLVKDVGSDLAQQIREEIPIIVNRALAGYIATGFNPYGAVANVAYPYAQNLATNYLAPGLVQGNTQQVFPQYTNQSNPQPSVNRGKTRTITMGG